MVQVVEGPNPCKLERYCQDNIQQDYFKEMFPVYLFMISLILSIMPQDKFKLTKTNILDYAQDWADASKCFPDLANGLNKPDGLETKDRERIQKVLFTKSDGWETFTQRKKILWLFTYRNLDIINISGQFSSTQMEEIYLSPSN
jgi:hypothetical protein